MTMADFEYHASPCRVIFGTGTLSQVPSEIARLGLSKPLILSTAGQKRLAAQVCGVVGESVAGIFSEVVMHTPIEVTEKALAYLQQVGADCLVSIGGGSTIGLGKALSIRTGLTHLCIPTTYAGSEVTPVLGETRGGIKTTKSDPKILPSVVIYDVSLTMSLPASISITSGINAIAHAVEALYAENKNPITSLMSLEGIKSLSSSLPVLHTSPQDTEARRQALYGAWLCGMCLGAVGMSLHHKLCHTLGGSFGLSHAPTHTIILPHALAYNAPSIPDTMVALAEALPGTDGDAVARLNALLDRLEAPRSLKELGMAEPDVERAAALAVRNSYWNPRRIEQGPLQELLRRAWVGERARIDW